MKIALILAALLALFLGYVALQPVDYRVERSLAIDAPAAVLFEQANNHRKFTAWNPFMRMDPAVKNTYTGPESGVGAICSWDGNSDIGAGASTIIESRPNELVRMRMDWVRPMEGVSTVDFTFKPQGGKTVVTWAMYGKNDFLGKLVSVFMDCEKMCGPEFEKGLADLAKVVGQAGTPAAAGK